MPHSVDRFLTTHTGSLPRPDDLIQMMYAKEEGRAVDREALARRIRTAVAEVVAKQRKAGLDIVNDGEMSKPSYATYVKDRLSRLRRDEQQFRLPGPGRVSEHGEAGVRRSRPVAAENAGLQRPDRRRRSRRRPPGRRQSEARGRGGGNSARFHDRRVAGRHLALLPQRPLPQRKRLSRGDLGCDAAGIRGDRGGGFRPADRLPGPGDGPAYPICESRSE